MKTILQKHNAQLLKATRTCLEGFVADLYANGLITKTVKDTPNFNSIISEFEAGLDCERDATKLTKMWDLFLESLRKQRGPAESEAKHLDEEWKKGKQFCANI